MARKVWPSTGYLPGMSPFPDGVRKPRRVPIAVKPPGQSPIARIATEAEPGIYLVQLTRDDTIIGGGIEIRRPRNLATERGRPVTYDHPLAIAARAGRKHALWRGPEPTFETAKERRAFEVARDRRRAWRAGER